MLFGDYYSFYYIALGYQYFVTASNNYNYVNVITLIKAALNNLKSTFSMLSVFCIVGRSDC